MSRTGRTGRRRAALAIAACLASRPAAAAPAPGIDPWQACDAAALVAERASDLPAGLLAAIGRVESGRWNPLAHRSAPWPYAIDVGGYDLFPDDGAAAAARVRTLQSDGVRSIDIGCFQINLLAHPGAFATVEEGFDPDANAAYAARFLLELKARTGSWEAAVAAYHSATPGLGEPYRARVYATWSGVRDVEPAAGAAFPLPVRTPPFATAAVMVRVVVPSAAALARPVAANAASRTNSSAIRPVASARFLPRVFTPTGS